ncbi:hypothetical protein [Acidaminococcus massiliensis]|uniref:hypothetical protein n=1 Tax=Acidaminococcus massiliensis TaxID=1852375 RepID=UPI00094F05C0|nr:hypothetical protein [Acidaminococcus massiliensis]
MTDILINVFNVIIGLFIGAVSGYAYAYFSGLKAMRKGMQLILRGCLNDMYVQFQKQPPTADEKQNFEEMFSVYEKLADNGVMDAKHDAVLRMKEAIK